MPRPKTPKPPPGWPFPVAEPPETAEPVSEWKLVGWANINKQGDITHTSNKRTSWARTPLYTGPQPPAPAQTPEAVAIAADDVGIYEFWARNKEVKP